ALGTGLELHARLDPFDALERLARQILHHALVAHAVALLGLDVDLQRVAGLAPGPGLFQARDDVAGAVEVMQRAVFGRLVDDPAIVVGQGVVDAGDAGSRDLHGDAPRKRGEGGIASDRKQAPEADTVQRRPDTLTTGRPRSK